MLGVILKDAIIIAIAAFALHFLFKFFNGAIRFVFFIVVLVMVLNFLGLGSTSKLLSIFSAKPVEEKEDKRTVNPTEELQEDYDFTLDHETIQ